MAASWSKAGDAPAWMKSGVEAAISFSFFSVCVFVSTPHYYLAPVQTHTIADMLLLIL